MRTYPLPVTLLMAIAVSGCAAARSAAPGDVASGVWSFAGTLTERVAEKEVLRGVEGTVDHARGTLQTNHGACESVRKCGDIEVVVRPHPENEGSFVAYIRLQVTEVFERRGHCLEWARADRVTCINWSTRHERRNVLLTGSVPAWRLR